MAMMQLECPRCGVTAETDAEPGTSVNCPACGYVYPVPTVPDASPAPAPAEALEPLDLVHGTAFGMEDGGDLGVKTAVLGAVQDLRGLDYSRLIPTRILFSRALFRKKAVRWVLLFGLLPLVFFQLHEWYSFSFEQALWLIEIYFSLFWALYFYTLIMPSTRIWHRAVGYALFTAFVGIPLLLAAQSLPLISDLYAGTRSPNVGAQVRGYVLGVGLFEEVCKALPLLWFGLRNGKITSVRGAMFLGLMSGFGFAAAEGVQYTIRATVFAHEYGTVTEQFMQFVFRLMSGPVLHGAWAGTVGWFIGVAAVRGGKRWPLVVVGIGAMALLHGLYDVFAGGLWGLAFAGLTFLIFMSYLAYGDEIIRPPEPEAQPEAAEMHTPPETDAPPDPDATP